MYEIDGFMRDTRGPAGMTFPVRHVTCGKVHDSAKVEVLERYSDCSRWKCPHCGGWCDDRSIGWGGSVEKLQRTPASSTGSEQP